VIYYNADHNELSGDGDDIVWPSKWQWIDYELEWACVMGAPARNVKAENAYAHIFGYTIFNDWSLRDVQMQVMEANLGPGEGKDFAGSNSLGPCIATADEFYDPYKLTMLARVNGEEWSRGSTSGMHHSFEDAIAQFSRASEVRAGEIIGSGTVLTGCGFELDRKLQDGDVVELEVEGIGVLRNRVVRS
jgi:2-keto-4-pentenoate hydratase/2-oxohepta-3-ene-1,7-dioic acid hydratase in catechol pathway